MPFIRRYRGGIYPVGNPQGHKQSGFYPGPQGRYLTRFGYPRGDILPSGSAPGFSHPDLRVFSGKTGMVAKCLGRGLVGGMGTLFCALLLWCRTFVLFSWPLPGGLSENFSAL